MNQTGKIYFSLPIFFLNYQFHQVYLTPTF